MRRFGPLPIRERSTEHLKHFNSNFDHGAKFHLRAGPRPVHRRTAMHSSKSEQSSDDSGAGDDPHRSSSVPNSLSQLQHAYRTGSDSVVQANPEKQFDEQDGQSYSSDLDTLAQSSQRLCLPSVSPVKRRQVVVSQAESDFDGVENNSLFHSPSNSTCGLNVNDVLCVQSESLVTLVQEY